MAGYVNRFNKGRSRPASKQGESARTKKLKDALSKAHPSSKWWKNHGSEYSERGLPDIMGVVNGRFYGFEIKVGDNWFSASQIKRLRELELAGGCSGGLIYKDDQWWFVPVTSMGFKGDRKRSTWQKFVIEELVYYGW